MTLCPPVVLRRSRSSRRSARIDPRPARGGFTLVEIFVALLLATAVTLIGWNLFIGDARRFEVDQARLAALQGALLFDEVLAEDLACIALLLHRDGADDPGKTSGRFDRATPFEVAGDTLEFRRFKMDPGPGAALETTWVRYGRDPVSGILVRESDEGVRRFRPVLVEDLQFERARMELDPASPGLEGLDLDFHAGVVHDFVKYRLTCRSSTPIPASRRMRPENMRITLVGAHPVIIRSARENHPYWIPTENEFPAQIH